MAVTKLHPESAAANHSESEALYYAYRQAKAQWELELFDAKYLTQAMPDELNDRLNNAHTDALDRYLLTPAADARDLYLKLRVFSEERIQDGWHKGDEITALLVEDGHRVAYPSSQMRA